VAKPGATVSVAVLTAVYGGYDNPHPLPPQDIECDSILLSDDTGLQVDGWRTVTLFSDRPARLAAKRPRCRPELVTDADVVVWLDAHVEVTSPSLISELVAELGDAPIGAFRHGYHTSIRQEAELASTLPKYNGWDLRAQARAYEALGHPHNWGMWTTGVMVRRPKQTQLFGRLWQGEIDLWGPEDQISLPFALRESGLRPVDLRFEGWWVGERFRLHPHNDGTM
jgi:hypothetical protein